TMKRADCSAVTRARPLTGGLSREAIVPRRDKAQLYEAIGEFVFQYSQLEYQLRWNVALEAKIDKELSDALIGPYDFAMLCTVLEKTVLKKRPDKDAKVVKKFFNRCRQVNEVRVKIVHGTWSVWSVTHLSRNTLEQKDYPMSLEQIVKHI